MLKEKQVIVSAAQLSPSTTGSSRAISRSVLSNWVAFVVNISVAFVTAPYLVHHLGDSRYGIWALVLQLTGYMGIFDVGLRSALVRFVAQYNARKNQEALDNLLSTVVATYCCFSILAIFVATLVLFFFLPSFRISSALIPEARTTLIIATATLVVGFPLSTANSVLAGLSRWDRLNLIAVSNILVRSALVIAFVHAGHGLATIAAVQFFVSIAGYLRAGFEAKKLLPNTILSWRKVRLNILRPVFTHSYYSLLISLGNNLNYRVDTIVISAFLPVKNVTFYVVGFLLVENLRLLVNASTQVLAPLATELSEGAGIKLAALALRASKYSLLLGYLGASGLLMLGREFIRLWMGQEFVSSSGTVLMILAASQFVSLTQNVGAHLLYGLGKHKGNAWCTGLEAILNLGISLFLVRRTGIVGVAIGTCVSTVVVRGWLFPSFFLRELKVPVKDYLKSAVLPTLLPTAALAGAISTFKVNIPVTTYARLVAAIVIGIGSYVLTYWLLSDSKERHSMLSLIQRRTI